MRGLLDPTAPAGFARAQRTYASIAQTSGLQVVPRPPKPRQLWTGKIPATVQQPRPWLSKHVAVQAPQDDNSETGSGTSSDNSDEDRSESER